MYSPRSVPLVGDVAGWAIMYRSGAWARSSEILQAVSLELRWMLAWDVFHVFHVQPWSTTPQHKICAMRKRVGS